MLTVDLEGDAPEASALLPVLDESLLERHGFDQGFWTVLDEVKIERAVRLVGHRRGAALDRGWVVMPIDGRLDHPVKTEDAEALTRDDDGWLYVFGSHFGPKAGPLAPKRAFVARFREDDLEDGRARIEILRRPFTLHRLINDALQASGLQLLPLGPNVRELFIAKTMRKAAKKGAEWAVDVRVEDWPINIEGARCVGEDTFVLGLRFPTTAAGEPILVRLRGLRGWFGDSDTKLEVEVAGVLGGLSDRSRPCGVRAMASQGDGLEVIVGPIGAQRKPTAIDVDYPESGRVDCAHVRAALPNGRASTLQTEVVRTLVDHPNVEGLARSTEGVWAYVVDDQQRFRLFVDA